MNRDTFDMTSYFTISFHYRHDSEIQTVVQNIDVVIFDTCIHSPIGNNIKNSKKQGKQIDTLETSLYFKQQRK